MVEIGIVNKVRELQILISRLFAQGFEFLDLCFYRHIRTVPGQYILVLYLSRVTGDISHHDLGTFACLKRVRTIDLRENVKFSVIYIVLVRVVFGSPF